MRYYSPLRYPGGKNKLSGFIAAICEDNDIHGHYVEPYAGGAAVALHLLIEGYVFEVTINDIDNSIYSFWYAVINQTDKLCKLIEETDISVENWDKQKRIQKEKADKVETEKGKLELGFSTFYLNRTNISGILSGGIIGGRDQKSKYKIDCRFNKENLIKRIRKIAEWKDSIHLKNLDALELIESIDKESKKKDTIFYLDPPYYVKGKSLYMNYYEHDDHEEISELVKSIKNAEWVVSYDNVEEIRKLYSEYVDRQYAFYHTARNAKKGKEILFFEDGLSVRDGNPVKIKP